MELHVVFNYSARGGLLKVFEPGAEVALFSDDLSVGPINPVEVVGRRAWTYSNIGYDNPDITEDERAFWPRVLEPTVSRVAWFSRRNAQEYCGFLHYLWRLGDLPTDIIDATDAKAEDGAIFRGVGSIPDECIPQIAKRRRALDAKSRDDFRELWDKVCADGAALRIVTEDLSLSSAPLSEYDEQLLALTGDNWRSMAAVLGDALNRWPVSDLFLQSRLYTLADNGWLDMRDTGRRHPEIKRVQP